MYEEVPSLFKEKTIQCVICDKTFQCKSKLKTHEKMHTGERPYKCTFCGKGCLTAQQKMIHERIHTGTDVFFFNKFVTIMFFDICFLYYFHLLL